jgi:ABC-type nitrate/sulfonate/bicarbonate transport system permease component
MKRRIAMSLLSALIVLAVWSALALGVSQARGVDFPTPWTTAVTLGKLLAGQSLADHALYIHVLHSLGRWCIAFAMAATSGVAYGLLAGWCRTIERLTLPIVHVLQLIPGLAWIPVALLLFGIGQRATLFMIAVTAFSPVALNVLAGVKCVDVTYLRAARMLGARNGTLLWRVLLPGALPQILTGLRLGLGNGWRVLVAAEMVVGTGTGLGYCIIQARWTLDYASAFVCLVLICLVGLFVERVVFAELERRTVQRWGLTREP